MASSAWSVSALLLGALVICFGALPGDAQVASNASSCSLTYASTTAQPLEFGVANAQGFFKQYNVTLCFRNVSSSTDVLGALRNKTVDFVYEYTDNILNWYTALNYTAQIFAGGMLGGEIGLAVSRRNNVTGYVDVPGRPFLVDSTTSGLVPDLWKVAELNGVNRATFSIAAAPNAQARYDYLVAGRSPNNQTVFGAMLEAPYWNLAKLVNPDILLLNRIGEDVSPIQSTVYALDRTRKIELQPRLVNLTAALIKANLYIYNATNKAAMISFIQTNNNLNPLVAADYYQSYVDGIQGSVYACQLSLPGAANVVAVRQNYDPNIRNENANLFVQPSSGTFYDDLIYKAAAALTGQRK